MPKPIFLWAIIALCATQTLQAQTVADIWSKMSSAMTTVKTATYELCTKERINGVLTPKVSDFRLQTNPFKVYGRNKQTGVEFLYVTGWNDGKAYINPNGFPWVHLNLDIYNTQVRNNNHHTINHAGFGYMYTMFKDVERRILAKGMKLQDCISLKGNITWNGRSCYHIEIKAPDYQWINHTCVYDEPLYRLCDRLYVLDFAVMEANKMNFNSKVSKGQQIKIPNFMAKTIVLYIDKENYLPVSQMIYDDKGLYEQYEYKKLALKPTLHSGEWTTQCAGYGFR